MGTYYSLVFNGSTAYVDLGTAWDFSTGCTYAAWAKFSAVPNTNNTVISKSIVGGNAYQSIAIKSTAFGAYYVSIAPSHTALGVDPGSHSLSSGTWIHLAITYDGTTLKTYFNGVSDGTANMSGVLQDSAGGHCALGTDLVFGGRPFTGQIAFPVVANVAMSGAQIAALAAGTFYPPDLGANLIGWWPMTEGSGLTIADASGNGNTGNLLGTPAPTWSSDVPPINVFGVGTANASSTASAVGSPLSGATGTANASSTANGVGSGATAAAGTAAGSSTANGVSLLPGSTGAANAGSTANAVGGSVTPPAVPSGSVIGFMQLDLSMDYLAWDNCENMILAGVNRTDARRCAIAVAKRRNIRAREKSPSGGAYTSYEVNWHIPSRLVPPDFSPKVGDAVVDAAGTIWTALTVELDRLRQRWMLGTVNLVLALELTETIAVQRADLKYGNDGAALKVFPPAGGSVIYTAPGRAQPITQEIDDERGVRYAKNRVDVIVGVQVLGGKGPDIDAAEDRVVLQSGVILDILRVRNPQRIDEFVVLECEERR